MNVSIIFLNVAGLTSPTGNCTAGHYCTVRAINQNPLTDTYGDTCPAGFYCPVGTADPVPCPVGTFLAVTGQDDVTDCLMCPPGTFCDMPGQTNFTSKEMLIHSLNHGCTF